MAKKEKVVKEKIVMVSKKVKLPQDKLRDLELELATLNFVNDKIQQLYKAAEDDGIMPKVCELEHLAGTSSQLIGRIEEIIYEDVY